MFSVCVFIPYYDIFFTGQSLMEKWRGNQQHVHFMRSFSSIDVLYITLNCITEGDL